MNKYRLILICCLVISQAAFSQTRFYNGSSTPFIHSHNDYYQQNPLLEALDAGAKSIEIDVWFQDDVLYVAHGKEEIERDKTIESLYFEPLFEYLSTRDEHPDFHLMVDIKTEALPTLAAIQKSIRKYPDVFNRSPYGIQIVISGNLPMPENYSDYDKCIWFDGRKPEDGEGEGADRVAIVSQNISHFTKWRGEEKIPEEDKLKLKHFVDGCHRNNLPVRFWNTPDKVNVYELLCLLGVDYLNTDSPKSVRNYLDSRLTSQVLPKWKKGYFDIHHISTGRGDASFIIMPDGTTMLVDMGDMSETHARILSPRTSPAVPDNSKTPAEWVADYIDQFHPKGKNAGLDYALITHFHDDHFGEIDSTLESHNDGNYLLTGIMELGSILPIRKIIDRGHSYPVNLKDEQIRIKFGLNEDKYSMVSTLDEYWKYIEYHLEKEGMEHEEFKIGSSNQFSELSKSKTPEFQVKNIFANGKIVNSRGHITYERFKQGEYPGENNLSTGINMSYGAFDYFNGGDISGIDSYGQTDINSMESNVAPLIGAVDVANLNHHGNRDSQNAYYVRTLRPRVWIQQGWSSDHPGDDVLRRITSTDLYAGQRDIFATSMLEANELVIGSRVAKSYQGSSGHIVVRVFPGGYRYSVFVLSDKNTRRQILKKFDYTSR